MDEAHATGLYGKRRRGLAEEMGVAGKIEIQMGTLGKALGSSGGYICGSRALIDFLVNRARAASCFPPPPSPAAPAAAALAGLRLVQSDEGETAPPPALGKRRQRPPTAARAKKGTSAGRPLRQTGRDPPHHDRRREKSRGPFLQNLREQAMFIPAIRYPLGRRAARPVCASPSPPPTPRRTSEQMLAALESALNSHSPV